MAHDNELPAWDDAELSRELAGVINIHSIDASIGVPDFILGDFLVGVLHALGKAKTRNDSWHSSASTQAANLLGTKDIFHECCVDLQKYQAAWHEIAVTIKDMAFRHDLSVRHGLLTEPVEAPYEPEQERQIAECPTPGYHESHNYCPSCPWQHPEAGN